MNYEQRIKEARTLEAMKNGYMGLEGKFSQITKKLGFPIVNQGGLYVDESYLQDVFKEEDENEIKTFDENEATYEIGRQFDALSRGINLTITVMYHLREITVVYEGHTVYKEVSGELESYSPDKSWEEHTNKLCDLAKKIQREEKIEERGKKQKEKEAEKNRILENLRKKWGI